MSLRDTTSSALRSLFTPPAKIPLPISSSDLLTHLVVHALDSGSSSASEHLRLTDLGTLEALLQSFSSSWEHGLLHVTKDFRGVLYTNTSRIEAGSLTLTDIQVRVSPPKKRKRDQEDEDLILSPHHRQKHELVMDVHHISKDLREVYTLLQKGTAKGKLLAEEYRSQDASFEPICHYVTKDDCSKARRTAQPNPVNEPIQNYRLQHPSLRNPPPTVNHCDLIHFRPLIRPHTDPTLGHCSYLNTCYSEPTYAHSPSIPPPPSSAIPGGGRIVNLNPTSLPSGLGAGGRGKEKAPCRYLHFEVDYDGFPGEGGPVGEPIVTLTNRGITSTAATSAGGVPSLGIGQGPTGDSRRDPIPAQWIDCDVRRFDYSVLGKFHAIMADPPWDIHMSLPYGTMTDDEMRAMPIPMLQDEGVLFLWVTGRAMEVGRECLRVWGYTRVDEVVWLKTNQLQRVIRTGRTGHWLNHTKEHMLVAIKTNLDEQGNLKWPKWLNRGLDTDVIVSEVRETSRKPEEVYGMIERMCPGGRKIEIFGRKHNTRPGWLTLGNQLGADQIYEEDLAQRIKARYPERKLIRPSN